MVRAHLEKTVPNMCLISNRPLLSHHLVFMIVCRGVKTGPLACQRVSSSWYQKYISLDTTATISCPTAMLHYTMFTLQCAIQQQHSQKSINGLHKLHFESLNKSDNLEKCHMNLSNIAAQK